MLNRFLLLLVAASLAFGQEHEPSFISPTRDLTAHIGSLCSGFIGSDFQKQSEAQTPLRRIAQPDDISPIAVFLASADSGWLSGETLLASGGLR